MAKNTVFIHTNAKQILGAKVGAHALRRNSKSPDSFEVRILERESFAFFDAKEGQPFLRNGGTRIWNNDDLQSFTRLRTRDLGGKAVVALTREVHTYQKGYISTSWMLLDCSRLTHWNCEAQFNELFEMTRDYVPWITLQMEDRETIGFLEPEWNHFDILNDKTKLLHNTKRNTQPWKTGLPVDYTVREGRRFGILPNRWFQAKRYKPHPDPRQEAFFFALLRECLDEGSITEEELRAEMRRDHIRHDALELVDRAGRLAAAE